jgi:hypothetical protein
MLDGILGAVQADVDRQIGWVGSEIKRQIQYTALTGGLVAVGAIVVGLIVLDT